MDKLVEISFDELKYETDAAFLVVIDDEKVWLPKSQVELHETSGIVAMPEWLAIEKDLI